MVTREAYRLAVWTRAQAAPTLRVVINYRPGRPTGGDRMASAVMDMFTDCGTAELGRRTIVTGITKTWFTPAVKAAARRRRAALRLMLCRPYDASARS